jgi:hypothetical protein
MKSITQHNTAAARTPGPGRQTERTTRRRLRPGDRAHTASDDTWSRAADTPPGGQLRPARRTLTAEHRLRTASGTAGRITSIRGRGNETAT